MNKKHASANDYWLYGHHPVISALQNPKRVIKQFVLSSQGEKFLRQTNPSLLQQYKYTIVDNEYFDKILPQNRRNHQGMAIHTTPLVWPSLEVFLDSIAKGQRSTIIMLDQLTDPQNIGSIFRIALAFGAAAIVMQERNAPEENAVIAKAAAGALELVPRISVTNLSTALQSLKAYGYWAIALDGTGKTTIGKTIEYDKKCFVFGSEGNGIRPLVLKNCDLAARIPISPDIESLNVATAVAIAMYAATH